MAEARFNKHVAAVRPGFQNLHEQHGETLDQVWVRYYARDCEEDWRVYFLRSLRFCTDTIPEARKALGLIVTYHHCHNLLPLPRILEVWTGEVAAGLLEEPTTKRPYLYPDLVKHWAMAKAMAHLIEVEGLQPTRNIIQKGIYRADCCFQGGSACDVVGKAVGEHYGENLGYKRIEGILLPSLSRDSPLYPFGPSDGRFIRHPLILRHREIERKCDPDPAFINMGQSW